LVEQGDLLGWSDFEASTSDVLAATGDLRPSRGWVTKFLQRLERTGSLVVVVRGDRQTTRVVRVVCPTNRLQERKQVAEQVAEHAERGSKGINGASATDPETGFETGSRLYVDPDSELQTTDSDSDRSAPQLDLVAPTPDPPPKARPFDLVVEYWRDQWIARKKAHTGKVAGYPRASTLIAKSNPQLEACLKRTDPDTGRVYTVERLNDLIEWAFWAADADYMRGEADWMTRKGHLLALSSLFRHAQGKLEERLAKVDAWIADQRPRYMGRGRFVSDLPPKIHDEDAAWAALEAF